MEVPENDAVESGEVQAGSPERLGHGESAEIDRRNVRKRSESPSEGSTNSTEKHDPGHNGSPDETIR
jgi:hypothetical protein